MNAQRNDKEPDMELAEYERLRPARMLVWAVPLGLLVWVAIIGVVKHFLG